MLTPALSIGGHLHVDLHEVLPDQFLAQPLAGLLQQPGNVTVGRRQVHAETTGFVAEVNLQTAQFRRVETDGGVLDALVDLQIDMLTQALPRPVRMATGAAADLLVLVFLGWVSWLAIEFTIGSWTTPMPSLRWPYSIHYAGAALGLALMTLRHGRTAWSRLVSG